MDGFGTNYIAGISLFIKSPFVWICEACSVNANFLQYPRLMMPLVAIAGPFKYSFGNGFLFSTYQSCVGYRLFGTLRIY